MLNIITPSQSRAARAMLDWTQPALADASGLGLSTIVDFEKERRSVSAEALTAIRAALDAAGIEIIADGITSGPAGIGIRLKFPAQIVKRIDVLENEGGPVGEDDVTLS